jgi:hypothetical protein
MNLMMVSPITENAWPDESHNETNFQFMTLPGS